MTQSSASLQVSLASSLSTSPFASLDHPLLPSSSGAGLDLENSLYALSHTITDNTTEPTGQKITLLSRPHNSTTSQSPLSTSPLANCLDDAMMSHMGTSGVHLLSEDGSPKLLPLSRDGYFDSEDPSVNLHEFIINSMQAQKNRVILLQLEEEFLKYITDQNRTDPLKLPSWDSYHRMLAHRVAAYFGLDHNVDPHDKTRVVVQKGPTTRIPVQRFSEHIPATLDDVESNNSEPKLILKRIRGASGSEKFDSLDMLPNTNSVTEIKSFEEREEEYEKARARIFSQSSNKLQDLSESTDTSFDLFNSKSSLRSALRAPMSHRRTFSDTAFFSNLFNQKKSKQGPSSSGNSPSNTPAVFFPSLSPPPSLTPPPFSKSTSPTIGVGAINNSPPPPPSVVSAQSHKNSAQEDVSVVQSIQQQQQSKKSPQSHPQTTSYVPVAYSQTPPTIPVVYHPQPALVNPQFYYNPMVVYPLSPHPAAIHTYSPMVNTPVLQPYPNTFITHPLSVGSQRIGGVRMPTSSMIPEPVSPTGVMYRPMQQASVQVKPDDFPAVSPGSQPGPGPLWGSPVDHAQFSGGYPNHQGLPSPQGYPSMMGGVASQLAEQMEKALTLNDELVSADPAHLHSASDASFVQEKSRMSPIVQRIPGNGRGLPGGYGYPIQQPGVDQVLVSPTTGAPPHGQFLPGAPLTEGDQHVSYGHHLRERQENHQTMPPPPPPPHPLQHHPHHPGMVQPQGHPQGMYSHSAGNITPTPVQILGHSLSTSIFSPPPSAGPGPPTVFYNPGTGKPGMSHGGSPVHAPVGSGVKFKKYNSPKQLPRSDMGMAPQSPQATHPGPSIIDHQHHMVSPGVTSSDQGMVSDILTQSQQLPPRLNQRTGGGGTRYQNQRHPSNRTTPLKGEPYGGGGGQGSPYSSQVRREPLLPTPSEMIKLDTGITAGVPVNVMEVLYPPHEDSPEYQVLIQNLKDCGAQDFKRGIMGRNTEVMVAIFDSPDAALQGLKQCILPVPAKLTIPLPNHARYILQLLST